MTEQQPKLYDAIIDVDSAPIEDVMAFNNAFEALCKALEKVIPETAKNQGRAAVFLLTHVFDAHWIYCQNMQIEEDKAIADSACVAATAISRSVMPEGILIPEIIRRVHMMRIDFDQDDMWIGTLLGCRGDGRRQHQVLRSWFKALPAAWFDVFSRTDEEFLSEEQHITATKAVVKKYQSMLDEHRARKRTH